MTTEVTMINVTTEIIIEMTDDTTTEVIIKVVVDMEVGVTMVTDDLCFKHLVELKDQYQSYGAFSYHGS